MIHGSRGKHDTALDRQTHRAYKGQKVNQIAITFTFGTAAQLYPLSLTNRQPSILVLLWGEKNKLQMYQ